MSLRTAERILVSSYDSEGRSTTSTEQVVLVGDGEIGFWLANDLGVRERFPDNCVVSVHAATSRGRAIDSEPVLEGRAVVLADGPVFDQVKAQIVEKYRAQSWATAVAGRTRELFGGKTPECVVVIRLLG